MKSKIITILGAFLSFFPGLVFGWEWEPEVNWPRSPGPSEITIDSETTVATLVEYLFEWGIVIAVVLFMGSLIYASFYYVITTGNPQKLQKARRKVKSAFMGTLLIFSAWLLLVILNPELAIISEVDISPGQITMDVEEERHTPEADTCDYSLVKYFDLSDYAEYPRKERISFIPKNDIFSREVEPRASVACKRRGDIEDDAVTKDGTDELVKFTEARVVDKYRTDYRPKCGPCQIGGTGEEEDYCYIPYEHIEENDDYQYCYAEREFEPVELPLGSVTHGVVKYVSQKDQIMDGLTCFAGDKRLDDGGGCNLGLFNDEMAGRCTDRVIPSTPGTTLDMQSLTYDRKIKCMELYLSQPILPDGLQ